MLALIAASATLMTPTKPLIEASWAKTHVVGHRGAAAYEPENTLASFRKAIESGASATECDVWMSRDGVAMIIHDATLDRTTRMKGRVDDYRASELRANGVPTLDDYLMTTKDKIVSVIEIKGGTGVEKAVVDAVAKHQMGEQVIVFSFNAEIISNVERLNSDLFTVWLSSAKFAVDQYGEMEAKLKQIKADGIGFSYKNVEETLPAHLRSRKIPLFVWTVPPGEEVDRLKSLRVNFIITDHPQDVRKQLGLG